MTFDTFKETIVSALSNYYGSDYTLSIQKIPKNNQIILDGLTIQKKGQNTLSVHRARMSARGRCVSAKPAGEFADYIVEWDDL